MLERVQKLIANAGLCSRRRAEELIDQGRVTVNGKDIKLGDKADMKKDKIVVDGKILKSEQKVYLALNKPKDYVTTVSDEYGRKKVLDLISEPERVFPVGRLDKDATGLLFLTNDGDWGHRIIHPRFKVEKEYFAKLDKELEEEDKNTIERGLDLNDGFVKAKITKLKRKEVTLVIHEGRKKIVKRIFHALGYNVDNLARLRIGKVYINNLKSGQYRKLRQSEIEQFQPKK